MNFKKAAFRFANHSLTKKTKFDPISIPEKEILIKI